jgi:hypothetical protein
MATEIDSNVILILYVAFLFLFRDVALLFRDDSFLFRWREVEVWKNLGDLL